MKGFKNYTDQELDHKQEKLDKQSTLRFLNKSDKYPLSTYGIRNIKINTISDILYNLHSINRTNTVNVNTNNNQVTGALRSIEDTYRVCKYYFPKITYREVYKAMEKLVDIHFVRPSWCYTVKRRVFATNNFNLSCETIKKSLGRLETKYTIK